MRKPKECYVYRDGEFVGKFDSQLHAAEATNTNVSVVGMIARGERKIAKNGYYFSNRELTKDEIQALPLPKEKQEETKERVRFNNRCKEYIENQEFEDREFFFERSKEGKKAQLKQYIYSKLKFHFLTIPKKQAILEKRFVDTLIDEI